jgi:ribosomal 50S subunit-associated protein YjgA (DUF615 family)
MNNAFDFLNTDANQIADAMREATVAGIDGLLDLQKQMNEAAIKSLHQVKAESDRMADRQTQALEETLKANVEIANRTLGWYREQVERFAKAPATPEA